MHEKKQETDVDKTADFRVDVENSAETVRLRK